jgi:hypothetical protein
MSTARSTVQRAHRVAIAVPISRLALVFWWVGVLANCKDKTLLGSPPANHDKVGALYGSADSPKCRQALKEAAQLALSQRMAHIIDACSACDAKTIGDWNVAPQHGGPSFLDLDQAMRSCHAYCNPQARTQFTAGLEDARDGAAQRTPWRLLQRQCPALFAGGETATRFASAQWFLLSAVAKDLSGRKDISDLPTVEFSLPFWASNGIGVDLPVADVGDANEPVQDALVVTILANDLQVSSLPIATLGAQGVNVKADFPGRSSSHTDVVAQTLVTVVAPRFLAASKLRTVVGTFESARLAVVSKVSSTWPVPSMLSPLLVRLIDDPDRVLVFLDDKPRWCVPDRTGTPTLCEPLTSPPTALMTKPHKAVVFEVSAYSTVQEVTTWLETIKPERFSVVLIAE